MRLEIKENLSFTPKETDIYKIHQSGDLANLDGLDDDSLKLLPSLKKLRDALYSEEFREYLCKVTGSSFVSGKKTDMAINVYTPGCHLLCHDDVIGSRRISYILYLTDPDTPWKEEWGGALRLYPTEEVKDKEHKVFLVPEPDHTKSIPPAFNQLSFFAVQPGRSFHDVEEVYAATPAESEEAEEFHKIRVRTAISGWYHIPQEGEQGYRKGEEEDLAHRSSLAQLQGKSDVHDRPQANVTTYAAFSNGPLPTPQASQEELSLSEEDLDFLLKYIAPSYLTPDAIESVISTFSNECSIILEQFLSHEFSEGLRPHLTSLESDQEKEKRWEVARPPHKHRYLYQHAYSITDSSSPLQNLLNHLLPSRPFQKWLQLATGQRVKSHDCLARRFRRGKDYTLAQSYENEDPRLEVCLSVTPSSGWGSEEPTAAKDVSNPKEKPGEDKDKHAENEDHPEVGGYLAYMAGEDNDDEEDEEEGSNHGVEIPQDLSTGGRATKAKKPKIDPAIYQAKDDEDDEVLFSMPAGWNKLGIVLRDQGTMRFVKYVSKSAKGDRWDVFGEFEIEDQGDDDDDDAVRNEEEETTIHDDDDNADESSEDTDSDDA